jgi:hypothetical protein
LQKDVILQIKKVLTPKSLVIFFLLFYLILGLFIAQDYGIGIDEIPEARRANVAMRRYSFKDPGDPVEEYLALGIDQYYGTPQMSLFLTVENTFRPPSQLAFGWLIGYRRLPHPKISIPWWIPSGRVGRPSKAKEKNSSAG